ncbi:MAG: hypothetical protein V4575_06740 [Pseudomonadota bacterium]
MHLGINKIRQIRQFLNIIMLVYKQYALRVLVTQQQKMALWIFSFANRLTAEFVGMIWEGTVLCTITYIKIAAYRIICGMALIASANIQHLNLSIDDSLKMDTVLNGTK